MLQHVVGIACHVISGKQIDLVILQQHDWLTVLDLNFFGHGIQDAGSSITDRTLGNGLHIHQDGIQLMFKTPAVFLSAIWGVHYAHGGKGSTGGYGSGNIDTAYMGAFCCGFCQIHDYASADAHDLVAAGIQGFLAKLGGCLIGALPFIQLHNIVNLCSLDAGQQAVPGDGKGGMAGQQECLFAEPGDFSSALLQKIFLLTVAPGAELDCRI